MYLLNHVTHKIINEFCLNQFEHSALSAMYYLNQVKHCKPRAMLYLNYSKHNLYALCVFQRMLSKE